MIHTPRRRFVRLAAALALASSVLLPAAAPAAAADPVVLSVGTTQDLDASNPFNTELVVGYEAFQLTYNLLTEFDKDAHPAEGFADTLGAIRGPRDVPHPGRHEVVGRDARDVQGRVLQLGPRDRRDQKDESSIGSGYLDPGLKDAGVTKIECPDDSTFIAYTEDQSDRIFQIYMPILPEHVYGKLNYKKIGDEKFDGPLVGTGPYTLEEWKTGQFARFVRNPNFWGKQGFADEVVLRFFADNTDTWSRRSSRASSTTPTT